MLCQENPIQPISTDIVPYTGFKAKLSPAKRAWLELPSTKERMREIRKRYCDRNRDRLRAENKSYREKDPEGYRAKARARRLKLHKTNPNSRLRNSLGVRISNAVKSQTTRKLNRSMDLVGCTVAELRNYLEAKWLIGMTWENYGLFGWHVDHIRPCSSFDLTNLEEQIKCFHYTNLQPLWRIDNLIKSDKYKPDQVIPNASVAADEAAAKPDPAHNYD